MFFRIEKTKYYYYTIMNKKISNKEKEFLTQSNWIENEYSLDAYEDSVTAWQYAIINKTKLDLNDILNIHYLLMSNINNRIAGKIRTCDVWIGGVQKHFISTTLIEDNIKNWLKDFQVVDKHKTLSIDARYVIAVQSHIRFEEIHPFEDGNGRVGRMLYNIQRINMDLPIHSIHIGDEQHEYYKWFK